MTAAREPACLVGLIGSGIQASRSPALHEREGRENGLLYLCQLLDLGALGLGVDALPDLLSAAERMGFSGLNITHPCKQAVIPLLDELSPDAGALGAVNTVLFRAGRRIGHNTDWYGFAQAFRRGLNDASRRNVVQFGAGGAGSAVAYAAMNLGAGHLSIIDVDRDKSRALAENLCSRFGPGRAAATDDAAAAMAQADGMINATPVGMVKYPGLPMPSALLRPAHWVAEVVYFPLETELLRLARSLGCRTMNGGDMAVFQAVEAFRLFSGVTPDSDRMLRHFASMGD